MISALRVIEKATGEVVEEIDLSNETETGKTQVKAGLRTQMNHEDYRIEEVHDDEVPS